MTAIEAFLARAGISLWLISVPLLLLAALLANHVTQRVLVRVLERALRIRPAGGSRLRRALITLAARLANIVPALVVIGGLRVVADLPGGVRALVTNLCGAFVIITAARASTTAVDIVDRLYARRPDAGNKPIKGYLQLLKLVIGIVAAILAIAALIDRNPLILLSGLGAMAAVLMLIFQDTLLSLVASVQLGSNAMVRLGDWLEMPAHHADGDVIEIALHTVKVQNWDKTITTLPVRSLITESFKNWRGMSESGGRRIMRTLLLDQRSIRFLSDEEISGLEQFVVLNDYLNRKRRELTDWNASLEAKGASPVNARRITNLGTFRAYVLHYLKSLPTIKQDTIIMVRQLQPEPAGIPLQIYCFTNTTNWVEYEAIQADIFDHLLAILPKFDLHVFQQCSDRTGLPVQQQAVSL